MTSNLARPYDPAQIPLTFAMPTFSRHRPELLFAEGEELEVCAFPPQRPLRCTWELARNLVNRPLRRGEGEVCLDQSVRLTVPTAGLAPGFYDLRFTVWATATHQHLGSTTVGYRVDELHATATRPADFDAFWDRAMAEVVPCRATETFVRELAGGEIDAYNVQHASLPEAYDPAGHRHDRVRLAKVSFDAPGGRRLYGWLAVPVGPGPFPGMLVLPGAGCAQVPAPVEHARHGYVALMLQIHGQDVDQAAYEQPPDYLRVKGGEPADEYYYGVYRGCAQALRYLAGRPEVDPTRLVTVGGSQGGQLALVTAALCPEVRAVVSALCYYGNWPLRDQAAALNAAQADGTDAGPPPFRRDDPRQHALSYFDTMNFAARVRARVLMAACLADTPSLPGSVLAVSRNLPAGQGELHWSPGTNHDLMFAFERLAWRWLERQGMTTRT
jgi:cephalosporin-C deacetylase-like acetyl esterase